VIDEERRMCVGVALKRAKGMSLLSHLTHTEENIGRKSWGIWVRLILEAPRAV
jgi:hypothetical protein